MKIVKCEPSEKDYLWRRTAESSETAFSLVRRVARRIRYRTFDDLIDKTLSLSSIDSVEADIQSFIKRYCPAAEYSVQSDNQLFEAFVKYGILDIEFRVEDFLLAAEFRTGIPLLKALGYLPQPDQITDEDKEFNRGFLEEMDEDIDKDDTLLKVFLVDPEFQESSGWEQRIQDLTRIPFPIEFRVLDACVTNSGGVWLNKHFYL